MILIIHNEKSKLNFDNILDKFILFKSICDIKTYKYDYYTIVLIDVEVLENGVLSYHNVFFEEIISSLNVFAVITNKPSEKLREICKYYNIALLELNY